MPSDFDRFFLEMLKGHSNRFAIEIVIDQEALYLFMCYRENYTEILEGIKNRIKKSNGSPSIHLTLLAAKQIIAEILKSVRTSIPQPSEEVTTLFNDIEDAISELRKEEKYKTGQAITLTAIAVKMKAKGTLWTGSTNLKQILGKKIKPHKEEIAKLLKHESYKDQWLEIRKVTTFKRLIEGKKIERRKIFKNVGNRNIQKIGSSEGNEESINSTS